MQGEIRFNGYWRKFWLLMISIVGIPFAFLYLFKHTEVIQFTDEEQAERRKNSPYYK